MRNVTGYHLGLATPSTAYGAPLVEVEGLTQWWHDDVKSPMLYHLSRNHCPRERKSHIVRIQKFSSVVVVDAAAEDGGHVLLRVLVENLQGAATAL